MHLLMGFAFLAGVVTVLSPCVLPILPVVLAGGIGGKARPWGVITGFVVGGRTLLQKVPWLTKRSSSIQRGFGILMVVVAVALFTGADRAVSTWILRVFPAYGSGLAAIEKQGSVKAELDKLRQ